MTTEKSADDAVLDDVFSSSRDRGADSAAPVETPTPQAEPPQAKEPPAGADPDAKVKTDAEPSDSKPKGYRDPDTGRFVPLDELKSEREKRQEAQKARDEYARLREESEERARRLEARLTEFERRQQAAQTPQQPPPDPNIDPAGALAYERQLYQQELLNQRLNQSETLARYKFGDEVVDAAFKAATEAGAITRQWAQNSRDFYGDLIRWHKRAQTLQRVGDDPDAYEKSLEEKIRAKVLEELKTGNRAVMPGQTPAQQPQRFPGTLVDETGAGPSGAQPQSDEAVMGSVFSSSRKRR